MLIKMRLNAVAIPVCMPRLSISRRSQFIPSVSQLGEVHRHDSAVPVHARTPFGASIVVVAGEMGSGRVSGALAAVQRSRILCEGLIVGAFLSSADVPWWLRRLCLWLDGLQMLVALRNHVRAHFLLVL